MKRNVFAIFALLVSTSSLLFAEEAKLDDVSVSDAWVRATVPGQSVTGLFMRVESKRGATLVGVSVPASVAGASEIHESLIENNVARMRHVPRLELAPGKPLEFKPGSYHVMLFDLKRVLKEGETVPVKLRFEQAKKTQDVEVRAAVRRLGQDTDRK